MKTSLKEILSSILCDVVLAQHRANIYSQSLAEEYENHTGRKLDRIPQVKFEDIALELHFVTDGTESGVNDQEIDMVDIDKHPYSSLLIDVNSSTMASIPPECIQTLRLKVSPHTIKNGND